MNHTQNFRSQAKKYTAWRWGEPTYIYNLYLSQRFVTTWRVGLCNQCVSVPSLTLITFEICKLPICKSFAGGLTSTSSCIFLCFQWALIYYISWYMNFGPVWFLVEWQTSRQTYIKWCIRAHRAIGTGGLKNLLPGILPGSDQGIPERFPSLLLRFFQSWESSQSMDPCTLHRYLHWGLFVSRKLSILPALP